MTESQAIIGAEVSYHNDPQKRGKLLGKLALSYFHADNFLAGLWAIRRHTDGLIVVATAESITIIDCSTYRTWSRRSVREDKLSTTQEFTRRLDL